MKANRSPQSAGLFLQIYGGGGIVGGTEIYLKNLLREIKRDKKDLRIYLTVFNKKNSIFAPFASEITDSRFTRFLDSWDALRWQYRFRLVGICAFIWGLVFMYMAARRLIIKHKIPAIYANGGHLTAIVAYLLSQELGVRYIVHFHGVFDFAKFLASGQKTLGSVFLGGLTRKMLDKATLIIANSKDVALDVEKVLRSGSKCSVVHCFVDKKVFSPGDKIVARRKLGLPAEALVIFSGNRLDVGKKIPLLYKSVMKVHVDIKCVIVGDGQLREDIEKIAKADSRFVYYPKVPNEELPLFINAADLVWGVCSVYYMSLTLIESVACGIPIMASKEPSPVDVDWGRQVAAATLPRKVGFLVEESEQQIADLLTRLSEKRSILTKMRPDCLSFYDQVYGQKNIAKVMQIIEKYF